MIIQYKLAAIFIYRGLPAKHAKKFSLLIQMFDS